VWCGFFLLFYNNIIPNGARSFYRRRRHFWLQAAEHTQPKLARSLACLHDKYRTFAKYVCGGMHCGAPPRFAVLAPRPRQRTIVGASETDCAVLYYSGLPLGAELKRLHRVRHPTWVMHCGWNRWVGVRADCGCTREDTSFVNRTHNYSWIANSTAHFFAGMIAEKDYCSSFEGVALLESTLGTGSMIHVCCTVCTIWVDSLLRSPQEMQLRTEGNSNRKEHRIRAYDSCRLDWAFSVQVLVPVTIHMLYYVLYVLGGFDSWLGSSQEMQVT